jgi:hypothetical protein
MSQIRRMERGKLCTQSRGPGSRPFHKLQSWHKGKNRTRYVPESEVGPVREAVLGYERFCRLVAEFVELTVRNTRQEIKAEGKKARASAKEK